ncbi:MAG: hypothetical protein ACE5NP_10370 [Anaerolineae bacterium]
MPIIPSLILKKVYIRGSLRATHNGFAFSLRNVLGPVTLVALRSLRVDGEEIAPARVTLHLDDGHTVRASDISARSPLSFPLNTRVEIEVEGSRLNPGSHHLVAGVEVSQVGQVEIAIEDHLLESGSASKQHG